MTGLNGKYIIQKQNSRCDTRAFRRKNRTFLSSINKESSLIELSFFTLELWLDPENYANKE